MSQDHLLSVINESVKLFYSGRKEGVSGKDARLLGTILAFLMYIIFSRPKRVTAYGIASLSAPIAIEKRIQPRIAIK
jgi:hypothetical protein